MYREYEFVQKIRGWRRWGIAGARTAWRSGYFGGLSKAIDLLVAC